MENIDNFKVISTFKIVQDNSDNLCLIDPIQIILIIFVLSIILYIIGYKI